MSGGQWRGRIAVAGLLALGLPLAGCVQPSARPTVATYGNTTPDRLERVVDLLEAGDTRTALRQLRGEGRRAPGDPGVATLIAAIERDPESELGTRSHTYVVQPGDSWLGLAQRHLGDRLKFYLLARYNGVAAPRTLVAGQTIRLPGDPPPPPPPPPPPEPAPPPKPRPEPKPDKPAVEEPQADAARARRLRAEGLSALRGGEAARAVTLLAQAQRLDPSNGAIRADLARARRVAAAVRARRR